ncbi:anion exchange protein 2 isoform X4 [Eupeodes corollae]|uniref:anion exchange protein 2 isoform X4 n=1 Tax=Eupeodes corollae TaxID=290404 RepID=UPI00248FCC1E|nr:anion exchange protein 2 isoform X4 [Eupeodes corollae]
MSGPPPYDNNRRKLSFLGFNTKKAGGNEDPDLVLLDTEMEKVFASSNNLKDKFDVSSFLDANEPKSAVGPFKQKQQRNKSGPEFIVGEDSENDSTEPSCTITIQNYDDIPEDCPLVSQRAEHGHNSDSGDEKHVQFAKKRVVVSPPSLEEKPNDNLHERKRRKSRHQYYRQRKHSHQDTSDSAKSPQENGAEPRDINARKVSVQPEDNELEKKPKKEAALNELTSHRSDDPRGLRRHKVRHSSVKLRDLPQISLAALQAKKAFDHSPHEIFVQLDELVGVGEEREWKETARWIKYEEDLEEGSDRWGKPHVASLSFHSLLNLRRCLETGVVLLDLDEKDLPAVAYRVVEQMVVEDLITSNDKPTVMRSLLLRHRHVNENSMTHFPFTKKKYNSYTSLQNLSEDKKPKIVPASEIAGSKKNNDLKIDMKDDMTYTSSQEDLKKLQNDTILKRIPVGAEATTVLVGAVEFLETPTIAFVRLAEGVFMQNITEVPIPVRFMFILLGPKTVDLDYHEVGRSIATLMANETFHSIAYKADDRKDLLSAINEFLDDSIVLPPGNWDRHDLLPFSELKAKKDWIRSRKTKALQSQQAKEAKVQSQLQKDVKIIEKKKDEDDDKKKMNPLEKTHKFWGGLRNDLKRRMPMYKSDILDGLNTETLAATVFMYFACLSTAITFGGLASDKTHNLIGISETLLAASVVGVVFHTLAGQPLVIIGTTGPLLLFDEALYQFCQENNFSFLTVRAYIGIWLAVIALTVSAFEGSVYVRLFTRFTQEIFSALITLIYIVETITKLFSVYKRHPLLADYNLPPPTIVDAMMGNESASAMNMSLEVHNVTAIFVPPSKPMNMPNTALFCTILTLGTFTLAYYLKLFRNSHFLGRNARRALGDFGVPIAIAIFVAIDYFIPEVYTEKLSVPEGISPSDPTRGGWFVPLGNVPVWIPFITGIPAILVYILIFMESHISELIVDKPERGLKKGSGLHFDIVLLCFMNVICGFFGMPWHCAATVRSVAHVSSLTVMSRTHAPGESPRIIDVKEQRISGFCVALMVGLSVTMAPLLRLIPMAVLFGVFLYMGIASMSGVQFFERVRLFFMPVKHYPPTPYVKRVPTWKMHMFTAVQVLLLAVLWAVKSSKISLAFPFFLIMMVPLRQKLAALYTAEQMKALDGSEANAEEDEPDFYEEATIPA